MDPMNPSMTTAQDKRHSAYSISCRDAGRALRVALIEVKVTGESGRKGASGCHVFFLWRRIPRNLNNIDYG